MNDEIRELARAFAVLKERHAEAKEELDRVNQQWLTVEESLIQALVDAGAKSVDLEGLGKFLVRVTKMPSVSAANKPDFFEYLRSSGNGGLIKEDVNANTLRAFLKTHYEELVNEFRTKGLNDGYRRLATCGVDGAYPQGPLDAMDANQAATDVLKALGASVYEKRDIQHKAK